MNKWRLLDTGKNKGALNMAIDEAVLNIHNLGLTPETLRIFRWEAPTLSIGRRQKLKEINLEECRRLSIDVVRRPTGAWAVLHDKELTYSLTLSLKKNFQRARDAYYFLNQGFVAVFKELGLEASLESLPEREWSLACFASIGRWSDLVCKGRKVVGSVLTARRNSILCHGSILIQQQPEILLKLLNFPSEDSRKKEEEYLRKSASLKDFLSEISFQEVKEALIKGFSKAFGVEFFEGELTKEEVLETQKLFPKYLTLDWWGEQ